MSVKLDGIDLNSAADSIEANNEGGFNNLFNNDSLIKNYDDQSDLRGVSVGMDRVLGEGNGTFNVRGSVNEFLNGRTVTVDRNEGWEAESVSLNTVSDMKEKNDENKAGVIGDGTQIENRSLCLELKQFGNDDVEMMRVRALNQGMGINVLPQNAQAREKVGLLLDLNARHNFPSDLIYDNVYNETGHNECLTVSSLPVSAGLSESTSAIMEARGNSSPIGPNKDEMFNGPAENMDGEDDKLAALIPNVRRKENQTEKEGEYFVSDLVWGKVRSHPWWPGVIFEPSSASEKAMEHMKKNSYLIVYFGDQTFAWNEALMIRPFHMYFSQMEKQSKGETFRYAVDNALNEVSRRIELGLACRCLKEEVISSIDSQEVVSAGVEEQSSRICGTDSFSTAVSFFPDSFLNYVKSLAEAPNGAIDRLEYVKARARHLAFNRWKGYPQLRTFEQFDGILGNEEDPFGLQTKGIMQGVSGWNEDDQVLSGKAKSPAQNSSQKRKNMAKDDQCKKQKKHIMELVHVGCPSLSNGEEKSIGKTSRKFLSGSSGQKRMGVNVLLNESRPQRRRRFSSEQAGTETYFSSLEHGGKSMNISNPGVSAICGGESLKGRLDLEVVPSIDEMLSVLANAAKNPIEGYSSLISIAGFFSDFRKSICMDYNNIQGNQKSTDKPKAEKIWEPESTGTSKFEGMEDSYWTDRIIESRLEEPVLFEPKMGTGNHSVAELDSGDRMNTMVPESALENQSRIVDDKTDEYSPTVLILNFTNLESVPPITNLNEIFSRYGPLNVSKTEVLSKSKRAKVVFKRRSDAETAFSSTGKFSIFGPALVSYRLKYLPAPRKTATALKANGR